MSWGQRFEVINYQAYDIGEPHCCRFANPAAALAMC